MTHELIDADTTHDIAYVEDSIERAADRVGTTWPLHSFVAANPLSGFEDRPFHRAVREGERLFGGRGYPRPATVRWAWETGRIDPDVLAEVCDAHGVDREPEAMLAAMEADERSRGDAAESTRSDAETTADAVDRLLSKWLAAFLDQGAAEWSMPNREQGFYAAWRQLAPYDGDVPACETAAELPPTALDALESVLSGFPQRRWESIFEHHLAALPGWTGLVKRRAEGDADPWNETAPITLTEYLAVRLTLADLLGEPIDPAETDEVAPESASIESTEAVVETDDGESIPLAELWLNAWETSYRNQLLETLEVSDEDSDAIENADAAETDDRPAAQLVFCIDTRSEVSRRHVEDAGPYETYGYAGFFGIPMRYREHGSDVEIDACPPIVDPQHRVVDRPDPDHRTEFDVHERWSKLVAAGRNHLKSLKTDVAAAFPFVEGAGGAYGAAMAARTLSPNLVHDVADAVQDRIPSTSTVHAPAIAGTGGTDALGSPASAADDLESGMRLEEKVEYAETAFELMGWTEFARLVVFVGHASETTNNPFASSLDCGACAGNSGGPNARVLAAICNDDAVQSMLRARGFDIPADTVFLAGEHNTTTDEITLFDESVPESHREDLQRLRADLEDARTGATAERAESFPGDVDDPVRETERRAADWAETRPEWGLAGNAAFVVGPRGLTAECDLEGRAFLHTYDWRADSDGDALEAIMTGPLVVTQWINSQYYFATVDNAVYGGGSKVTQNPVGNVGVVQGNGGDLMTGLPLQSVAAEHGRPYHQPLRLTAVLYAPVRDVADVLHDNEQVATLFDNGWLNLTVIDPERGDRPFHYQGDLEWEPEARRPLVH